MGAKAEYAVRSVDWREDDFEFKTLSRDAEDAIQDWCTEMDSFSNFIDGYPEEHEVEVMGPDGSLSRHIVGTDWHPSFYVTDVDPVDEAARLAVEAA